MDSLTFKFNRWEWELIKSANASEVINQGESVYGHVKLMRATFCDNISSSFKMYEADIFKFFQDESKSLRRKPHFF